MSGETLTGSDIRLDAASVPSVAALNFSVGFLTSYSLTIDGLQAGTTYAVFAVVYSDSPALCVLSPAVATATTNLAPIIK